MRQRRRLAAAAAVLGLVASACGTGDAVPEQTAGPTGAALPLDQQVVTIGTLADQYNLDPGRVELGKFTLNTGVFDAMVRLDEDLQVRPVLAERWDYDEAASTYRFHLRKGVKFHDGSEFGAEDVKYTLDLIAKQNPSNSAGLGPDSMRVVDPSTIDITTVRKNNRLVEDLAHPIYGVNRRGSDPLQPLGTGPFRFVEYIKNDRFVVERFADYWDTENRAKAKRIVFRFIPDAQTKVLALRGGDVDLVMDVPRDLADGLEGQPGVEVVRSDVGAYNALNFSLNAPAPYGVGRDPAVREAVAVAIDREALLAKVWGDNAEESRTWIPPQVLGSHADTVEGPTYDPRRAERLLDGAGWVRGADGVRARDGQRLSLVHVIAGPGDSDPRDSKAAAEFIQDQLKKVGVETRIEVPEAAAGLARAGNGEYDILHYIANQNSANPCLLPDLFFYSKGSNRAKVSGPGGATDAALEECRAATTPDGVRRAAAEAVRQLVDVEHVVVPLMGIYRIWAMRTSVAGFRPHPTLTNQRWESVRLTEDRG